MGYLDSYVWVSKSNHHLLFEIHTDGHFFFYLANNFVEVRAIIPISLINSFFFFF